MLKKHGPKLLFHCVACFRIGGTRGDRVGRAKKPWLNYFGTMSIRLHQFYCTSILGFVFEEAGYCCLVRDLRRYAFRLVLQVLKVRVGALWS